ncbi:MAG: PolC-type DNA polymerase III [Eubacteriaceae bacterium]|nr:PolC-type DNA polymerase III [Eubacteriaceae bacterium]
MKKLIDSSINWDSIGTHDKSQYRYEITDAVISKETGELTIALRLNFVMPVMDMQKVAGIILHQFGDLKNVRFTYEYEDVILTEKELLTLFIPHMIMIVNGDYILWTQSIIQDKFDFDENTLTIHTIGKFAAKQLNKKVAILFQRLLKENFNMEKKIVFVNDEESYESASEMWKKTEEEELKVPEAIYRTPANHPKKVTAAAPMKGKSSAGNGFSGGGFRRREKETPAEGNRIMGRDIIGQSVSMSSLAADSGTVILEGILFNKESRPIKNDKKLVTLLITDKKTSVCLKCFCSNEKWEEINTLLKNGDYIKVRGETEWDKYDNCLTVMIKDITKGQIEKRRDTCEKGKRVELHAHTKMSAMDGLNEAADLVKTAAAWGQPAVAVTDHGVVQSFPDAAKTAKKLAGDKNNPVNIKIIYGMEGYVFDDKDWYGPDGTLDYKTPKTNHIILIARTQEGLKNIYKLVSYSHLNYFYKKPRLPKSVIARHRDGLIIGSACEAGEVYSAMVNGASDEELEAIAEFYDYLEIQPVINNRFMIEKGMVSGEDEIRSFNKRIVALGKRMGKPVVATTDAHYGEPEDAIYRNILMAGMGFKDAENGQGLYMRTTDEMLEEFSYLGEDTAFEVVIENTNKIADMVDGTILPVPKGKFPPKIEGAEETLRKTCMDKAHSIYGDPLPPEIESRLETELNSIINNGYAVMYVSAQMLVHKSMSDGYLVGSRGSVGSSFAATMAGITEVNPLDPHYICPNCKHIEWGDKQLYDCGIDMPEKACPKCGTMMNRDGYTIPFATFLGFNGDKEPDIDLNFAGEYQPVAHKYVGEIFGEKNVFKAGTVGTVADKTAFGYVKKFAEEFNRPINKFEADRLSQGCTGVKRTTGQHPGGIIIVPDDHEIYEFCPVQHPANDVKSDIVTTHFDYHKIDENLLKLDILGHNIPSMIRQLQDMTGIDPMKADLTDRKVLSIFNGIEALDIKDPNYKYTHGSYAIPEFGTSFVRQMLDDTKPDKFADLVRISGFSHGTDVWLNNAQDYIRDGTATMREVISTRDDIMNYLILKGIDNKTSFQIMEDVRKNRPLKEEQLAVMKEHDVPDWYIDSCIKIQYMFPRAHAVAYVMMSFRMAWYKVYYPVEFYATYFSSTVSNFDTETILKGPQACLDRIQAINDMGNNATTKEQSDILVLEVAYEMYSRGYEFTPARLGKSKALKFWADEGKVLLPFVALDGLGDNAATAFAEAYDEKPFDTVEEAINRSKLNKTAVEALRNHGVFKGLPETDQLSLF